MFYLFLYFSLLEIVGFLMIYTLARKVLNRWEILGLSFGAGLSVNFLLTLVFTLLSIRLSRVSILLGLATILALLLSKTSFDDIKKFVLSFYEDFLKISRKKRFIVVLILLLVSIWFFWLIISEGLWYGDEFSFWGKAARMIYNARSLRIQNGVYLDFAGYPLLFPANVAGSAFMIRGLVENYLKLINIPIFYSMFIFFYGYLQRLKFSLKERIISLLLFLFSGYMLTLFSTLLYSDLPFLYMYSIGTFLLIGFLSSEKNRLLLIGTFFLIMASNIRANGFILALISIFSVGIFFLKEKRTLKNIVLSIIAVVSVQIIWLMFVSASKTTSVLPYANQAFKNLNQAIPNTTLVLTKMFSSLFFPNRLVDGWGVIWWLILPSIVVGAIVYKTKELYSISLNVLLNFLFLVAVYLFIFREEEMKQIASFPRYVLGFLPIAFLGLAYFYTYIKKDYYEKS